ncbi:hypothetical protein BJF90_27030 [Pseudonocardia sp. CNS-004]|nr:hypothetical protein BJF90_27030 [Pseudonocardia sp. CNS-004]
MVHRPHRPGPAAAPGAGEPVIDGGFAGAPVWEADTAAVIGMVVPGRDAPRMLPIDDVLGHDPEQLPGPYQGLRPFDEEHADTFFGRAEEIARLTDLVARRPVVAVAGPSGAGKSSLVRAGLVPRLRAAGTEVAYVRVGEGQATAASLPDAGEHDLVMVLDQFEELAALDPTAARELLAAVVDHTDPRHGRKVRAVLTLRWNSLDELSTPELVEALAGGTVLIGPLGREQLREAIVEPARRPPGLGFEPGLVETILDDAGAEPGRLPLVESLLAQVWERREGGFLTMAGYTAAGGVAGALARHADEVVDGMPPGSSEALRRLLTALARPDRDGRLVRRPVPVDQLPADQEALLAGLTAGRLVTVSSSAGSGDVVDLAHQALLDHWPRLRNWLEADREFLAWREKVDAQRERWESEDRDDAALLRGAALAGAGEWLPARAADLTAADRDYLRRSTAHRRREVRRWQLVAAVLGVLAVGAAVLTAVTVSSGNAIADQLTVANADALGRVAQARAVQDPAEAAQLALAAWRADPRNPQARAALLQSYVALRGVERELPGLTAAPITDLLVGGDTAVLVAAPHPVVVTGLSGPDPRHRELTGVPFDRQLTVSPDGRWLAVQKPDLSGIELRELAGDGPAIPLQATPGTEAARPVRPRFHPPLVGRGRWRQPGDGPDPRDRHRRRRAARARRAVRGRVRRHPHDGPEPGPGAPRAARHRDQQARRPRALRRRRARHPARRRPVRARRCGVRHLRAVAAAVAGDRHPGRDPVRRRHAATDLAQRQLQRPPPVRRRARTARTARRTHVAAHRPAHR